MLIFKAFPLVAKVLVIHHFYLRAPASQYHQKVRSQTLPQEKVILLNYKITGYFTHTSLPRSLVYFLGAFIFTLLSGQPSFGDETKQITFSCWIPPDLPAFSALEQLYRESFAALGYSFTMVHRPAVRSLAAANQGITDGECVRVANYLELNSDSPLERVDVMVAKTNLEAWSYDKNLEFDVPASLLNPQHRIAYGQGTAVMQLFLARFPQLHLQEVSSINLGIKMLARERIDILIAPGALVNQELARKETNVQIYSVGTLMALEGHPYLHQRHYALLPALVSELRKLTPVGGISLP